MASVYKRSGTRKLWCAYHDAHGERHQAATPYEHGQEELATRFADELERQAKRGTDTETGTLTFRVYVRDWIKGRRARGIECDDDEARIAKYATPTLGRLTLSDMRPRHVRDLVLMLKAKVGPEKGQLAPRTVHHIFGTLHTMFADAVVDELVANNPCKLKRGDLPKKVDKDPLWRAGAVFTREEVELLISSEKIPEDRRVLYAALFLTGTRFGEAAALRWSAYDKARKPLAHLLIAASYSWRKKAEKSVKTQVTREVPVHATLARILADWKLSGWQRYMGRQPKPDDLILPFTHGGHRNVNTARESFHLDLKGLGLRRRRMHDARRTFITLARRDGARADILEAITHGPRGDIINVYTSLPWELLCEEVAKLKVELRGTEANVLPMVVNARPVETVASTLLQPSYSVSNLLIIKGKDGDPYGTRTRNSEWKQGKAEEESVANSRDSSSEEGNESTEKPSDCSTVAVEKTRALLEAAARANAAGDLAELERVLRELLEFLERQRGER